MQTRNRRILSVSTLGSAVAALLMLSTMAASGDLFLLGDYDEVYRPDLEIELGRHDPPSWRVPVFLPHGEPDPFLAVEVRENGVHIESVGERPSDDEGHRTGILSSTLPVGDGFEAAVHIDVRALDEDCHLVMSVLLVATNCERYEFSVGLAPTWAWSCWGLSFGFHDWNHECPVGKSYAAFGMHTMRLQYDTSTRTATAYLDGIPIAVHRLPEQTPSPMKHCEFRFHADGERRIDVTILDMLIGFDTAEGSSQDP